jgi:hypothetical protein
MMENGEVYSLSAANICIYLLEGEPISASSQVMYLTCLSLHVHHVFRAHNFKVIMMHNVRKECVTISAKIQIQWQCHG